jgi:hypothetical protein
MKPPPRNPRAVIRAILQAGLRVILIWTGINLALMTVAVAVCLWVWMGHGFLSGLASGIAAFLVGQVMALYLWDSILQLPEKGEGARLLPTDDEVIEALRAELEADRETAASGESSRQ